MTGVATTDVSLNCSMALDEFNSTSQIGGLLFPSNNEYWSDRTGVWYAFFYIFLVIFGILFLSLAILCLLLLAKRHLAQRFKVRTFIAIDVSLTVLGISRVFFIILDPWGQSEFCMGHIACRVLSRLSGALAFPSLTASYTLVFITLWMSAQIQLGLSSYQKYKVLIPLCFIHYVVAITFEIIGLIPWPQSGATVVISLLIGCEILFSVWGFLVCFGYLFAGYRLLNSIEKSARKSSVICRDSPNLTRHQLIEKSKFQNRKARARTPSTLKLKHMLKEHHRRAIRKVSIIMYLTVTLGMLYSVLSLVNLTLVVLTIYDGCPGYIVDLNQKHPGTWLFLQYTFFSLEFMLAILLTYSISDYRPVLIFLKETLTGCFKFGNIRSDSRRSSPDVVSSTVLSSNSRKSSPEVALNNITALSNDLPATPSLLRNSPSSKAHDMHVTFKFDEISTISDTKNTAAILPLKSDIQQALPSPPSPPPDTDKLTSPSQVQSNPVSPLVKESHEYSPPTPSPLVTVYHNIV